MPGPDAELVNDGDFFDALTLPELTVGRDVRDKVAEAVVRENVVEAEARMVIEELRDAVVECDCVRDASGDELREYVEE